MKKQMRITAVLMTALLGGVPAGGQTIRIAIEPPGSVESRSGEGALWAAAAALWFQESLPGAPGVSGVSEPRQAMLFQEVKSGAWLGGGRDWLQLYRQYEPVDALLTFSGSANRAELIVWTGAGRRVFTPGSPRAAALPVELAKAAAFVADTLDLAPAARLAVAAIPKLDGDTLAALALARQTTAAWPRNAGEAKLLVLQPAWKKHPADPRVCAEILRAAAIQVGGRNRDQSYTAMAVQMAKMALPPVLGSSFEGAVLELARVHPDAFVPELERAAAGLLKQAREGAMGAALDDLLKEPDEPAARAPAPGAAGAWVSGVFTRDQQLGAARVLARLDAPAARAAVAKLVAHPDEAVQRAVTAPAPSGSPAGIPPEPAGLTEDDWIRLAQDPDESVAAPARRRLAAQPPADPRARAAFDIRIGHPVTREASIRDLMRERPVWAADVLAETVADNADPHTRGLALRGLAELDAARARQPALAALARRPGHRWERLKAAVVLADHADESLAAALRQAVEAETEPAVRDFLEAARARADGRPAPPTGPAARRVAGARNLSWLCSMGLDAEDSPFDAYYCLSQPSDPVAWRRVYDKGKIFFVRIRPVGHPGLILLNRQTRDRFWLEMEKELPADVLPMIDGVVLGEETMSLAPDGLWADGWRLFCETADLDPDRVAGNLENLSEAERRAWRDWAYGMGIAGFNRMVAHIRTRYARERPGLQVCTFLPGEQGTTGPGMREWDFDVAGIYDYKGDHRLAAYSLVRRLKTLWPDRPVIWLSLGIGGYEMNPVRYSHKAPVRPMLTRRIRAYADAAAAWMAGADTGWFSVWIFVDPKYDGNRMQLAGVQVNLEDITPDSPLLKRGIDYAFRGVEALEALQKMAPPKKTETEPDFEARAMDEEEMAELTDLLDGRDRDAEVKAGLAARQEALRLGFQFYRRFVYDCARVFRSLPRLEERPRAALAVQTGVSVWTTPKTPNPLVPGHALLNDFDFLDDYRQLAEPGADLSRYRMILAHDPGEWSGPVRAALTDWLARTDGVLYVNRPGPLEGMPWSEDVRGRKTGDTGGRVLKGLPLRDAAGREVSVTGAVWGSVLTVTGNRALALLTGDRGVALAVWRDPARFKGVVVLDGVESASRDYLLELRAHLLAEGGAAATGLVDGPVLHGVLRANGVLAAAVSGYYREVSDRKPYEGWDLLTGELNPEAGGGLSAALVASDFRAGHVWADRDAAILAERIPDRLERVGDEWVLQGGGLVRIAAMAPVHVTAADGAPARIVEREETAAWLAEGQEPGVAVVTGAVGSVTRTYVRADGEVRMRIGTRP